MIKIFTKKDCPLCPGAKDLGQKLHENGKDVEFFDIDTASGLAEASFYTVMSTPTIILTSRKGDEINSWRGEVPSLNNILQNL